MNTTEESLLTLIFLHPRISFAIFECSLGGVIRR